MQFLKRHRYLIKSVVVLYFMHFDFPVIAGSCRKDQARRAWKEGRRKVPALYWEEILLKGLIKIFLFNLVQFLHLFIWINEKNTKKERKERKGNILVCTAKISFFLLWKLNQYKLHLYVWSLESWMFAQDSVVFIQITNNLIRM